MNMEKGEVYRDNVFGWEVTIVEVNDGFLILDDRVEDGNREYQKDLWEHNVSVGRFEKLRDEEDVEIQEAAENGAQDESEETKGILDY